MKVLILGCGSIGTRRANILADMGHELLLVDPRSVRTADVKLKRRGDRVLPKTFKSLDEVDEEFDAAVICTPPDGDRWGQVISVAEAGAKALFVEKPLSTDPGDLDLLEELSQHYFTTTMGACNLRFDERVPKLKKRPFKLMLYMGQHSKHWSKAHRPISLVLDSFHEFDLACHLAGKPLAVHGLSTVERAQYSIIHEGGAMSFVQLDRTTDPPERGISVWTNRATVPQPANGNYELWPPDKQMYVREMQHFIDCVEQGIQTCNPLEVAAANTLMAMELL